MVYSNKFVMCVLVNGTPCEELANGTVKVPFNTEYVLRFRNKNNRRAVVKVSIDGENISETGFIIPANSHIDIKRPTDKDAAFKFVSLDSSDAIDHGKNGSNDDKVKGTIEAKFYLEKELSIKDIYVAKYPTAYRTMSFHKSNDLSSVFGTASCLLPVPTGNKYREPLSHSSNTSVLRGISCQSASNQPESSIDSSLGNGSILKDGCTVEGNTTGQNFRHSHIDCEDTFTTLKVFLQGFNVVYKKSKKNLKKNKISELEEENENLRKQIAELENKNLKSKLASMQSS